MLLIQSLISFTIIVLSLLVAALVFRDSRRSLHSRFLALMSLSVAASFLSALPDAFAMPGGLLFILQLLSVPSVGLMWCFIRSLLDDEYYFSLSEFAVVAVVSVFPTLYWLEGLSVNLPWLRAISVYGAIPPFIAIAYLVWCIIRGFRDDLVEPRRRFRLWVIAIVLTSSILSILSEELQNPQAAQLLRSVAVLPSVVLLAFWLLRFQSNRLLFREPKPLTSTPRSSELFFESRIDAVDDTEDADVQQAVSAIDPKDQFTLSRLQQLMAEEKTFLEPGLSINTLAQKLKVPEHQLRSLINQGLGHRNFAQYLAVARIQHAQDLLADPKHARRQILSIALDSGFASLATFNRTFKSILGTTPTDFRNEKLQIQLQKNGQESR